MTSLAMMDEATIRRIVSEELARQLEPIRAAMATTAPAPSDDPLSRKDLQTLLGVSSRTLRRMLLAGVLPAPIASSQRACWWPRSVIQAWLDSGGLIQARAQLRIRKTRASL